MKLWRQLIRRGLLALGLTAALLTLATAFNLLFGADLVSDERAIGAALNASRPGYAHILVLGRLPGSTERDRKIRFRVNIQASVADLTCEGLLHYLHQDTPIYDLTWDTTDCAAAAAVVQHARRVLDGLSLDFTRDAYGPARAEQVIDTLRRWAGEG